MMDEDRIPPEYMEDSLLVIDLVSNMVVKYRIELMYVLIFPMIKTLLTQSKCDQELIVHLLDSIDKEFKSKY